MILTSTVKIKSKKSALAPVKTTMDIPMDKLPEAMAQINKVQLNAPVALGDIVIENFIFDGCALVVTKTIVE